MKAVGYARVSTEEQAREGVSLENQRKRIEAFYIAKEWILGRIYVDEGVSGGRRPFPPCHNSFMKKHVGGIV